MGATVRRSRQLESDARSPYDAQRGSSTEGRGGLGGRGRLIRGAAGTRGRAGVVVGVRSSSRSSSTARTGVRRVGWHEPIASSPPISRTMASIRPRASIPAEPLREA